MATPKSDRPALVSLGTIVNLVWELASWTAILRREQSKEMGRKTGRASDCFDMQHQQPSPSWLWDAVGHRKALFDRIGGYGHRAGAFLHSLSDFGHHTRIWEQSWQVETVWR